MLLLGPPHPDAVAAPGLTDQDRRDIQRVERYLNSVRSLEAGFLQISSTGQVAEGRLYLQRPKQLRLDYRPPSTLQIYANGYWLIFVDNELSEVTHVPLSSTPAGFLVRERVDLSGDVTVTRIERGADMIRVHVVQTDEPESGTVILSLSDRPLELRNWTVVDAQGVKTRVSLVNSTFNRKIDNKIFEFNDTRIEDFEFR